MTPLALVRSKPSLRGAAALLSLSLLLPACQNRKRPAADV